jgi:anti-sigma factor RsiW
MNHPDMETQVDAYLDGELAAGDAAELEAHLASCASCARFRSERLVLRSAIRAEMPKLEAPELLRARYSEQKPERANSSGDSQFRLPADAQRGTVVWLGRSLRLELSGSQWRYRTGSGGQHRGHGSIHRDLR